MNPISSQDVSALADAVRRRHRASGASPETLASLEEHLYRVMTLVEDLSEGESLNTLEYSLLRASAILHDAAAAKSATVEASAALAAEMLAGVGADPEFARAVATAIRCHDAARSEVSPESHAEQLLHDVCLLARIAEAPADTAATDLRMKAASLYTPTALRLAAEMIDARTTVAAPA